MLMFGNMGILRWSWWNTPLRSSDLEDFLVFFLMLFGFGVVDGKEK
jgi:hypothetical protein